MKKSFVTKTLLISILLIFIVTNISAEVKLMKRSPKVIKSVVKVELKSQAKYYVGVCPVKVKMTGIITVSKAMSVKYFFKRSDNTQSRLTPLVFSRAGSREIPFSWSLSKDCQAWVQLVVKTGTSEIKSEKIEFTVDCDERKILKKQVAKINWSIMKKPILKSRVEFKVDISKLKVIKKLVDLTIVDLHLIPMKIYHYEQPLRIFMKVGNQGVASSSACKLKLTFIASVPHPVEGKVFDHMYNIPALPPGGTVTGLKIFHHFWPGEWRIVVHVDPTGLVAESDENNNFDAKIIKVIY